MNISNEADLMGIAEMVYISSQVASRSLDFSHCRYLVAKTK